MVFIFLKILNFWNILKLSRNHWNTLKLTETFTKLLQNNRKLLNIIENFMNVLENSGIFRTFGKKFSFQMWEHSKILDNILKLYVNISGNFLNILERLGLSKPLEYLGEIVDLSIEHIATISKIFKLSRTF